MKKKRKAAEQIILDVQFEMFKLYRIPSVGQRPFHVRISAHAKASSGFLLTFTLQQCMCQNKCTFGCGKHKNEQEKKKKKRSIV